ncbi:hypothetical protein [Halorientalis litorea]|jgi:hypothetical protein|uniref:hypothetical protein n=1 Tax=Halorientalis litorea TaxID=2931977 RepID=UPI001FF678B1|nr:hypothetical protein [Halorientalis litorea]
MPSDTTESGRRVVVPAIAGAETAGGHGEFPKGGPYGTERAVLRARVAALEHTVARRNRQLQAVIDQYERVLDERGARTELDGSAVTIEFDDENEERGGVVERVRAVLR